MELNITIGGPLAEAINNLAAALHTMQAIDKAQAPKTEKADKPAKADKPVKPVEKTEAEAGKKEEATVTASVPDVGDLRAACDAVVEKYGIKRVKDFLADFGIAKLVDMPDEKRADALATLRGML